MFGSICLFVCLSVCLSAAFEIRFKFESDDSDSIHRPIRFDSKVTGRFEIFESAAPAVVPQTTLTVQQKTSTLRLVIEIYFMFMILCLCIASAYTLASDRAILFEEP